MDMELDAVEQRVLGSLVEKAVTTPEQYPLSVNAVVNACNQKSAREPVMSLSEGDVRATLGALTRKNLVRMASGYGGRVSKYEHRLAGGPGTPLALSPEAMALLALLFLRGPQTSGELRTRAQRLFAFDSVAAVESALDDMAAQPGGPLVRRLAREPGKRECRYAHTLGSAAEMDADAPAAPLGRAAPDTDEYAAPAARSSGDLHERVAALEAEVAALRGRLAALENHDRESE